ncbi:hypothetical protein MUK42_33658 [Musa troglodytarum]|uniref:Uncharacterized protein n=1 Tax=Musa troglodytarum TaxID=320322 RepID=A0A9E7FXR4_9LILI|nr:hypothetical protein MUK42_33658 [Musa troglodytarum]
MHDMVWNITGGIPLHLDHMDSLREDEEAESERAADRKGEKGDGVNSREAAQGSRSEEKRQQFSSMTVLFLHRIIHPDCEIDDSSDAMVQKMNQSMNITSTFSSCLTLPIVEFTRFGGTSQVQWDHIPCRLGPMGGPLVNGGMAINLLHYDAYTTTVSWTLITHACRHACIPSVWMKKLLWATELTLIGTEYEDLRVTVGTRADLFARSSSRTDRVLRQTTAVGPTRVTLSSLRSRNNMVHGGGGGEGSGVINGIEVVAAASGCSLHGGVTVALRIEEERESRERCSAAAAAAVPVPACLSLSEQLEDL